MTEVTRILTEIERGDPHAAAELLPLVYAELRKLAAAKLAHEKPGQTLEPTALVHEAYLRLVGDERRGAAADERRGAAPPDVAQAAQWHGRGHFFAAAAEAMRRILIEKARAKGRVKRGGLRQRVDLDSANAAVDLPADHLLELDEAISRLEAKDAQAARIVKLHCFAGLSIEHAALALGISTRTAYRDWNFAQAWLYRAIRDEEPPTD